MFFASWRAYVVRSVVKTKWTSFDFGSFWDYCALICAICELFTPRVEVSGKEGKINRRGKFAQHFGKIEISLLKYIFDIQFTFIILFIYIFYLLESNYF